MASKISAIVAIVLCFNLEVFGQNYCYQHRCQECPAKEEQELGSSVKCDFKGQVGLAWLSSPSTPNLNFTNVNMTNTFACIKMIASKENTDINGDSTDVIKGCVFDVAAESVCDDLKKLEASRNKKAECYICNTDNCNKSSVLAGSIITLLVATFMSKVLS